jgi:hypothetical protein
MKHTQGEYPASVEERINIAMESIMRFYEEDEIDMTNTEHVELLRETVGEVIFNQWLTGDTDEMPFDIDKLILVMKISAAKCILHDLQMKGLVDQIEDGDGTEYVFLTDKGKSTVGLQDLLTINLN